MYNVRFISPHFSGGFLISEISLLMSSKSKANRQIAIKLNAETSSPINMMRCCLGNLQQLKKLLHHPPSQQLALIEFLKQLI